MTLLDDLDSLTLTVETIFHCAVCGSGWLHLAGVRTLACGDRYEAGFCRGAAIRLHFFCEDGHHFDLDFGQHKGSERVRVTGAPQAIIDLECEECGRVSFPDSPHAHIEPAALVHELPF